MKRSEAIAMIVEEISLMRGVAVASDGEGFYVYPEDNQIAERILNVIENKIKMLPPTIKYNSVDQYESISNTDILDDNNISFTWEPENEKI